MSEPVFGVVHVLNGLRFGGCERLCLQLVRSAPPGVRQVLINLDPAHQEMREVFSSVNGLRLVDCGYRRTERAAFLLRLTRELRRSRAQGVVFYAFGLHLLGTVAARAAGVRRVLVHAGNPPPLGGAARRLWRGIVLASIPLRVRIKSCSAAVDEQLRALCPLPAGSEPIPNGVDVRGIRAVAEAARERRPPTGFKVVGMVARLNAIKDQDTLIRAFALVHRQRPDSELWLVGDGERRSRLEGLARKSGVAPVVRFLGEREDVAALLGQMDVFAFSTTRDEGFGIALAEAMAARTPVVASDVAACREVLGGGQAGRLVPPGDADALAKVILELFEGPQEGRDLSRRAYERASDLYDQQACAARYYSDLLPATR